MNQIFLNQKLLSLSSAFQNQESIRLFFSFKLRTFPRLDFFLLVVSQIFLKIKKLERNSKIIDRRLEREEREQIDNSVREKQIPDRVFIKTTYDITLDSH